MILESFVGIEIVMFVSGALKKIMHRNKHGYYFFLVQAVPH